MRDFTPGIYEKLLNALQSRDYQMLGVADFVSATNPPERCVILRHDVDRRPAHALLMARLEAQLAIRGTYYFRVTKKGFSADVIEKISGLGHEIGYHYEELAHCKGDMRKAIALFQRNLENLREICPVSTISMHGSPWSAYDNRDIWKHCDYRKYGIIAEAYLDIDYSSILYLTDTGRSWGEIKSNIRDRVASGLSADVSSTGDFIRHVEEKKLPDRLAITLHPQRWHNAPILWLAEWGVQQVKNVVKPIIAGSR